jgi:coenzyme F420-dependent glucose-6-phosphate dehydrogenase
VPFRNPLKISIDLGENYNDPLKFVECAEAAEKYDFDTVWFGDHFLPWFHGGNKSSFVWSVVPVALDRTNKIKVGPDVTCPIGGRFHPAIIAQASATIDNMYPGRFSLGVGSGEAINEARFFPGGWPSWNERIERLDEAIVLMRQMWEKDDYFDFTGKYFSMKDLFLYTRPRSRIPVYFSALGPKAAHAAGVYGDHLVTIGTPEHLSSVIFPAFESGVREAAKDPTKCEKMVLLDVFYGTREEGLKMMKESGEAGPADMRSFGILDPRKIQEIGQTVSDEKLLSMKIICSKPEDLISAIEAYVKIGANHIDVVTNSFPDKIEFVGEKVLPHFQT